MTPRATYRIQVRPNFDLDRTTELLDYLADLGISHVYCSPLLQAAPGSSHGYDVVDPTRIDEERGGEPAVRRLADRAHEHGMGVVLDIVPNHVAVLTRANPWWWDVLQHGPDSPHAGAFDIQWSDSAAGVPQIILPVLGEQPDQAIKDGSIRIVEEDGQRLLAVYDDRYPLRPGTETTEDPHHLLEQQHYRLLEWRSGARELNYRRFFDVKELAGLRIEDPDVFASTHARVLSLIEDDVLDGLRVDHPDGLRDPAGYARRLRQAAGAECWIVFEKILEPGEELRPDWPIDGTVGYDLARLVLGVLIDRDAEAIFTDLWDRVSRQGGAADPHRDAGVEIAAAKRLVVREILVAETRVVSELLREVAEQQHGQDPGEEAALAAVRSLTIAFPVYRTYVDPETGRVTDEDRRVVHEALATSRARGEADDDLLDLLADVLLLSVDAPAGHELCARFQQLTGPVMAKGVEDTAWYRYLRFPALNEVGGDPSAFGLDPALLHDGNARRQRGFPRAMLTTSTHDTKRSEDVRARLAVLTELPDRWVQAVSTWQDACATLRGEHGPDPAMEYLAWHTVVGAWPIDGDRLAAYLLKAAREQKHETRWRRPDEDFERDLESYAHTLVDHEPFLGPLRDLLEAVIPAGRVNSLTQTLVKLTAPGVPDVYQGCELWDLSLVDPDNRRPVDYDRRRALLDELRDPPHVGVILGRMDDGLPKLWLTRQALRLRAERPAAFGPDGDYDALHADGPRAEHVLAWSRAGEIVAVAPRLTLRLGQRFGDWEWDDTVLDLPAGTWRDALTGASHDGGPQPLERLLREFPVALLARRSP